MTVNKSNKIRRATVVVITLVIITSSALIYYDYFRFNNSKEPMGPGLDLSILPVQINQSTKFLGASVQIYMNNPPSLSNRIESYYNVTPLFNGMVNSTGNLTANLSYSFFSMAENWTLYFSQTNNIGASTYLTAEISYFYQNDSSTYVYYKTLIIPINPALYIPITASSQYVTKMLGYHHLTSVTINDHPLIVSMRAYHSMNIQPMGIAGGSGNYMWVLYKEHTFPSGPIPLAWANNSLVRNNNETIVLAVTLGSISQESEFHPGEVGYQNGTYYYSDLNGSSYASPNVNGKWVAGTVPANALPLKEGEPNAIMEYVVGSLVIDVFKEYVYTAGGWQPTNNLQSITGFASLNVTSSGNFQMGFMWLSRNSMYSGLEPENLLTHMISSNYTESTTIWISNNETDQWGSITDSITTSSSSIWPEINSAFGLALSAIAVIAAAESWAPLSGYAELAQDVLVFSGLASSIYGFVEGMVTSVNNMVNLFSGGVTLQNLPSLGQPNDLEMKIYTNNAPLGIITSENGQMTTGQFNIPIYDLLAIAS